VLWFGAFTRTTAAARGGPDGEDKRVPHGSRGKRQTGFLVDAPKLRVVIVEDSPIIRARLAEALAEIPNVAVVGHAETEAEAITILGDAGWDAAVLDLQLKKGTGLGVLKAVGHDRRPAHAKIIVFTNYAFPQYKDRSLKLGADYFFDKSREFHRVREVLSRLAGGGPATAH
jgi:DNA-binding NarL/FixJ family response regulator